jgi:hypothetical protein
MPGWVALQRSASGAYRMSIRGLSIHGWLTPIFGLAQMDIPTAAI